MPGDLGERSVRFFYTNYRGERSIRTAVPVILSWGRSQWHPRPQWLMIAFDMDKGAERTFALEGCRFVTCDTSDQPERPEVPDRGKMVGPIEGQEMCGGYPTERPEVPVCDGRPCSTDAFLTSAVLDLDVHELNDACVAWVEGAWTEAMKGIRSLEDGQ